MNKKGLIIWHLVILCSGCAAPSKPEMTSATPAAPASPTATLEDISPPTQTLTPTPLPSATVPPTLTPTPEPTSAIISVPEIVDSADPAHMDRPQLSGTVRYVDTEHFRIFFTMSGKDTVEISDKNGNAIPDYIEEVAEALEYAWHIEIEVLGWSPPPSDQDLGGDHRYDVYIQDLDFNFYGVAEGDQQGSIIGDNPNSDLVELNASFSYITIDNDFTEVREYFPTADALNFMRTTVAHELHHGIQFGYDSIEPHDWLWESTSTWIETLVYGEIRENDYHLTTNFKSPDTCLLSRGGDPRQEDRLHWYSKWLLLRYLSEQYQPDIIREIWEQAILLDGYEAIEAALQPYGTDLNRVLREYALALLFRSFEFNLEYPTVRLEANFRDVGFTRFEQGVGQLGIDYIEISAPDTVDVWVRQVEDGMLVGIKDQEADIFDLRNGSSSIDTNLYDRVYLVILNLDRAERAEECRFAPYSVEISPGEEIVSPDETRSAVNFLTPRVTALESTGN